MVTAGAHVNVRLKWLPQPFRRCSDRPHARKTTIVRN
jgi:hypothetical protein